MYIKEYNACEQIQQKIVKPDQICTYIDIVRRFSFWKKSSEYCQTSSVIQNFIWNYRQSRQ